MCWAVNFPTFGPISYANSTTFQMANCTSPVTGSWNCNLFDCRLFLMPLHKCGGSYTCTNSCVPILIISSSEKYNFSYSFNILVLVICTYKLIYLLFKKKSAFSINNNKNVSPYSSLALSFSLLVSAFKQLIAATLDVPWSQTVACMVSPVKATSRLMEAENDG